jgi:Fe-S-cluster containining protein
MNKPLIFRDPTLKRSSAYSYVCKACNRCCRNYFIRVNPYEILRLAQFLNLSATDFIEKYVTPETALVHKEDDTCIFLGPHGCSVHSARPLVCRVYPLGRHISGSGEEHFFHMEPHPATEGVYGEEGTVGDYLNSQGALPFMEAADRYLSVFHRYYQVLAELPKDELSIGGTAESALAGTLLPELLNPEKAVAGLSFCNGKSNLDPDVAMDLHLEVLEAWLTQFQSKENKDGQEN